MVGRYCAIICHDDDSCAAHTPDPIKGAVSLRGILQNGDNIDRSNSSPATESQGGGDGGNEDGGTTSDRTAVPTEIRASRLDRKRLTTWTAATSSSVSGSRLDDVRCQPTKLVRLPVESGATMPRLIRVGEKIVTDLSPHSPPMRILPPSAAPKRDHDEWLVRWRPGGLRVAAVQAETITARTGSPVKPLSREGSSDAELPKERSLARMSRAGATSRRCWHPAADRAAHRSRDAAGDAPRPWWHRPKTPAGRRGVSLFHLRTTRVGANASPVPLHLPR